jgi:diguanylate cyclase (GGDEF)-like protein
MTQVNSENQDYKEEIYTLLLESSLRSVPFNIALATLLIIDLYFSGAPFISLTLWYLGIILISFIRWFYSKIELSKKHSNILMAKIYLFTVLVFITSIIWGSCYFLFTPHVSLMHEFIIILVMGGMSAGAVASLSIFLPAYYAYIVPMFLPVIIYNFYSFQLDRVILSFMCLLFLIMLIVTAGVSSRLLHNNLKINKENQWLIKRLSRINTSLENTNEKLLSSIEEIRMMSITDPLTGLYNRRHFNTMLKNEIDRAKRNKQTVHLVLIDVDNFKYINDTFGHPAGDDFLIKVASSLKRALKRASDTIYRLGGDEFAITLVNLDPEQAKLICYGIQNQFKHDVNNDNVSLSMGLLSISPDYASDIKDIIASADKTLYQAKNEGRNRIIAVRL